MKLFRTVATLLPPVLVNDYQGPPDQVVVFIESLDSRRARHQAAFALAEAWRVPISQLGIDRAWSEDEITRLLAIGEPNSGDARLFELPGDMTGGLRLYAHPERTLFLVRPATLPRLIAGQRRAMELCDWGASSQRSHAMPALLGDWGMAEQAAIARAHG